VRLRLDQLAWQGEYFHLLRDPLFVICLIWLFVICARYLLLMLRKRQDYASTKIYKIKILEHFTTGGFCVSTHLTMAFLLLGFLLLTACDGGGGGGGSADVTGAKNCTLGASALDSCTLK
jgi:hypothetical protein